MKTNNRAMVEISVWSLNFGLTQVKYRKNKNNLHKQAVI